MKEKELENIFLACLKSNQRLKWFLANNIDLINYLYSAHPRYMAITDLTLAAIPKKKRREIVGNVDINRILKILKKERPDLYKTLTTTSNGLEWLERQIYRFEKRFLE